MRLKQLEIFGFKSFAKHTTLEFPTPVVAIVGPNGSGKSNVSEAVRWVLGEQSMKSLRGKRGEDLIFHGSSSTAQLGKAMVKLTFDNSDHVLPVDFEEVVLSREVYRDGVNEYKINGSQVRLKDVIEILSKLGIGGSGHHIISQGEADRILYASSVERKAMLEDALGLKIYEIKRAEAARKLGITQTNMREVEVVRREIQPHLKFLRVQADKIEASSRIREELRQVLTDYLIKEGGAISRERERLRAAKEPIEVEEQNADTHIQQLLGAISQEQHSEHTQDKELPKIDHQLFALEEKRREMERELGRTEGQLSILSAAPALTSRTLDAETAAEMERGLASAGRLAEEASLAASVQAVQQTIQKLREIIAALLGIFAREHRLPERHEGGEDKRTQLGMERDRIKSALEALESELSALHTKRQELAAAFSQAQRTARDAERQLRDKERALNALKDELRSFEIEHERLHIREEEYARELADAERFLASVPSPDANAKFAEHEREETRRKIERLKIKLEEAGGIDDSILKEFQEISNRDVFLSRELEDLRKTASSLQELMGDLAAHLEQDFRGGIEKINTEFSKLFATMFGGGHAELKIIQERKRARDAEEETSKAGTEQLQEEEEVRMGVDISADLPRKRIKGLDMLSGGERALTSIALLFAMSAVNPPPFLVLDETDAALDEANSQRYGAMLKDLSSKTQLVVITHNRQTMHEAGVLYGVTMGADGISKLLSIKLEEAAAIIK